MGKIKLILFIVILLFFSEMYSNNLYLSKNITNKIDKLSFDTKKKYNLPDLTIGISYKGNKKYVKYYGEKKDYLIGSLSKSFTALAILLLEEKDKIKLKDPIKKYLPWFKYKTNRISDLITVEDLLRHKSGILRIIGLEEPKSDVEISEYYNRLLDNINYEDRSEIKFNYSNINYQLLGLIIEKVSKKSYMEFLSENILNRIKMKSTNSIYINSIKNLISSYQYFLYFPIKITISEYSNLIVPSGFISSSTEDMLKYLDSIRSSYKRKSDSLFKQDTIKKLFLSYKNNKSFYGMGWEIRNRNGLKIFKHDGLTQSFAASMAIVPDLDLCVIIMTNINNSPSTVRLANNIINFFNSKKIINYSSLGFYFKNSLPLFAFISLIYLFFTLKKWRNLGYPIRFYFELMQIIKLIFWICFSLIWIIYIPLRFNTPLDKIIIFEPNTGYSLVVLSISTFCNSIIRYLFSKNVKEKKYKLKG